MRISVQCSSPMEFEGETEYTGNVTFSGFIGSDQEYTVYAFSEEEAEELITEEAADDLEVTDVEDLGDGNWEVTVNFAGFIGVNETYSVYEDNQDDAEQSALEEARSDLEVELI